MVDELLILNPHKLSFSEASMRIMITPHFSPRTRLSMAGRMVISEVWDATWTRTVAVRRPRASECVSSPAETEAHPEEEASRRRGWTGLHLQQPAEKRLLRPGERRQSTQGGRRVGGRSRGPDRGGGGG